jgi:hypothetical protein
LALKVLKLLVTGSTVSSSCTVLQTHKSVTLQQWREWRKEQLLKITGSYEPMNIYIADETGLFFRLPPNKTWSLTGDLAVVERIPACSANGTDELPPLVTDKNENHCCFKISESCS